MSGIVSMIEKRGYTISRMERKILKESQVKEHYAHHVNKPFSPELLAYMLRCPVYAMIVEGEDAVQGMVDLSGNLGRF